MSSHPTASPLVLLPQERGSFIGREDDVERLVSLLENPECRLVTLLGPGGAGKTRLAIETARAFARRHLIDTCFVDLQPVETSDRIASVACDALNVRGGQDDPLERLLNYLSGKEMLLVFDNVEHLIEGVGLISEMLDAAAGVKLVTTSRESIRLQSEWRFDVDGLPFPVRGSRSDPMSFGAVQLFVERARRVKSPFEPTQAEIADIVRLCSLVQGSPLAIELAASWFSMLTCADIATEIERNIDFLATERLDVPPRHRSMQAVFNQSWEGLTADQQDVFRKLSVFRGGFTREAAAAVAGGTLGTLFALVDRSLIRQDRSGRYQVQEVLRQFAAAKLEMSPAAANETLAAHASFYTSLLKDRSLGLFGSNHREIAAVIRQDLDNILAAYRWALQQSDVDSLAASYHALGNYFEVTSLYAEGTDVLSQTVAVARQSPEDRPLLARVLVDLGWSKLRVGEVEDAASHFVESIALHDELALPPAPGQATEPRTGLGIVELVRGNFEEAGRLGHEALKVSEQAGQSFDIPYAAYLLTNAYLQLGNTEQARAFAGRAYEQARANDDLWFSAYCLNELGEVAAAAGDLDAARAYFNRSFEIRSEFDDPEGMALALNCLGRVALQAHDPEGAASHFIRSLATYRHLADKGGLAASLKGLGEARAATGHPAEAAAFFQEALDTSLPIGYLPMTLSILADIAELLIRVGKLSAGCELLRWLSSQEGLDEQTRFTINRLLEANADPRDQINTDSRGLPEVAAVAQSALISLSDRRSATAMKSALAEPLSDREKEVLACVARGLSNREIADTLILSVGTVKAHTHNIYEKLDAANRVQALARAREFGLIPS